MFKKWMGAWGKDYQRGCLVQLLAVVIAVPLLGAFIFLPLYLANRPGVSSDEALWIMAVPAAVFLLLMFGGSFGAIWYSIRRRGKWLDAVFLPLGLEGRQYAVIGRQYHGRIQAREVDVFYARGPLLTVYVGTRLKTRLSLAAREDVSPKLAGVFNNDPLELTDLRLVAYAHDAVWGREFVAQPEVVQTAAALIFEEHPFLFRQVILNPEALMLRLYRSKQIRDFRFTPEQGRRWIEALIRLAEIGEGLPAPGEEIEESGFSEKARQGKLRTGWIAGGIVALLIGIPTCVAVITVLVLLYLDGG